MSHPAKTEAAVALRDQITAALSAAEEMQRNLPNVADYRITCLVRSLREAAEYGRNLADGTTPGLAEARERMLKDLGYTEEPK